MAISRFRNILPELDPTIYSYNQQEYLPDLTSLGTITSGLQEGYDKLDYLDIPKHLQEDIPFLKSKYIDPVEKLKESAIQSFSGGETSKGLRDMKEIQRFLHKSRQPGGIYQQLEGSYGAYNDYISQLDKLYEKGEIGATRRDQLKQASKNAFKGSFDPNDVYSPFSGISAAFEQDRLAKGLEIGKGWKADKFPAGIFQTPQGYFRNDTKTRVDPNEVLNAVYSGLGGDQKIMSDLTQEGQLQGLSGKSLNDYVDKELKRIATTVAQKEGFSQTDSKFLKDWQSEQLADLRNKYNLIDYEFNLGTGEHETRVHTVNSGMPELSLKEGKVKKQTGPRALIGRAALGRAGTKDYIDKGFDQIIKDDPEFAENNPALVDVITEFPRNRSGNNIESNGDYNKRVKNIYDMKRKALTTASSVYDGYGAKRRDIRQTTLIGEGNKLGDITHKKLWLKRPGLPPIQYTYEDARKLTGHKKDDASFIKSASVLGETKATNSLVPSGEEISVTGGDKRGRRGKIYHFTVENISHQDQVHKKDIYALSQPLVDGSINETDWYVVGGEKLKTKGVDIWQKDSKGNPISYNRGVHIIGENGENLTLAEDKDGNPIYKKDVDGNLILGTDGKPIKERGITLEQLEQVISKTNTFSPFNMKTTSDSGEIIISNE